MLQSLRPVEVEGRLFAVGIESVMAMLQSIIRASGVPNVLVLSRQGGGGWAVPMSFSWVILHRGPKWAPSDCADLTWWEGSIMN